MYNFIRTRTIGVLAVTSGAAVVSLAPGIASAASAAPEGASAVSHSREAKTAAVPPNSDFDFRKPGIRIYQAGIGTITSKVVGLGYPGQGYGSHFGPEYGPRIRCVNGQVTATYVGGTDRTTHVTGWVPYCDLVRLR